MKILPLKIFKEKLPDLKLGAAKKMFVLYFQERWAPLGCVGGDVDFNGLKYSNLELCVVDSDGPPLLGRIWFKELGFQIVNSYEPKPLFYSKDQSMLWDEAVYSYLEVFSGRLGTFTDGAITLELKSDAKPKLIKARSLTVPFALRAKVDAELERLVQEGILIPINYSSWGSPIVPVMKKGGTMRICGDYKLTLNPCLEVDQYPLQRVEDLFHKVQGSKVFAKMYLSHAHQQVMVDESRQLQVICK